MSRRGRHGRPPHPHPSARPARPGTASSERTPAQVDTRTVAPEATSAPSPGPQAASSAVVAAPPSAIVAAPASASVSPPVPAAAPANEVPFAPAGADGAAVTGPAPTLAREAGFANPSGPGGAASRPTCTQAQLRRFIKSRPWVPMHELRRRFGIDGVDDDVSPIRVGAHTLFIGLPLNEGRMMAELLGGGDVGYELSMDPVTPVVVGVYPMRPVPRS